MDFNWNDLKHFIALARSGNPNAAARLLKVDHNTVRRHVAALEADLAARLFDRRGETYWLTDEGERLLSSAEAIEGLTASAQTSVSKSNVAVAGSVRIGMPDGLATLFLAPRLAKLQLRHPDLQVELVVTSRHFQLSKREADMAVVIGRPKELRTTVRKLAEVSLHLYGSQDYLASRSPVSELSDLRGHIFISGVDDLDFAAGLRRRLTEAGVAMEPSLTSTSSVAQLYAAAAGAGLGFFSAFMVAHEPRLRPVLTDQMVQTREVWLAVHTELKEFARIRAMTGFLVDEFSAARSLLV